MSNENHNEISVVMVGNCLSHLRGRRGERPAKGHSEFQPFHIASIITDTCQSRHSVRLTKTLEDTINASEDDEPPRRKLVRWNEYQGPHVTLQFGAGILYDYGAFAQDQDSKRQIAMYPGHRVALDTTGSFSASTSIISTSVDYNRS